jgi:AcrR family transcriptional regulator
MTKGQLKRQRRPRTRAVAPEAKSERRAALLAAAEALLERDPEAGFAVGDIARRAGLAKGTVYLYFGSREEILLAVHDAQLDELFRSVEQVLAQPRVGAEHVARAVLGFLSRRREFFRLATNCHGAFEDSVPAAAKCAHREVVAARLTKLGSRIETLHPAMRPGEGLRLLMNCYAQMLGLWQLSASPLRVDAGAAAPAALQIDFETQLAAALADLWNAAVRRGKGRTS